MIQGGLKIAIERDNRGTPMVHPTILIDCLEIGSGRALPFALPHHSENRRVCLQMQEYLFFRCIDAQIEDRCDLGFANQTRISVGQTPPHQKPTFVQCLVG